MKWHSFWVLQVRSSWLFNSLRIIQTNLQQWDLFPECFTQIVSSSWNYCNVKSSIAVGIFFSIYGFWLKPFEPFSVYADGSICLDILQNQWSPIYDVAAILTSIQVYWKTNLQYGYNCCVSIIARPLIEELLLLRSFIEWKFDSKQEPATFPAFLVLDKMKKLWWIPKYKALCYFSKVPIFRREFEGLRTNSSLMIHEIYCVPLEID